MGDKLPPFTLDGVLPPGDYELTFSDLKASLLVSGPEPKPDNWDAAWRHTLVCLAERLVGQLWAVGIEEVYLDGSFVEDKAHPHDIDGYFPCSLFELPGLVAKLNEIDPHKSWTWSNRVFDPDSMKNQLPMWHAYRTELYPHFNQPSGIYHGTENLTFPQAFRRRRGDSLQKGIIRIVR